jgi:hypothetical protein
MRRKSDEVAAQDPKGPPSFLEFKAAIFQGASRAHLLDEAAELHGKLPRIIRVLHNFDPTSIFSALDQVLSEQRSEADQDKILQAIYNLTVRIWKLESTPQPRLPGLKFNFLYRTYVKSETDLYKTVSAQEVQQDLDLPQLRVASIGQFLDEHGLIEFNNWYTGIKIRHSGIVRLEADLLTLEKLPSYVTTNEIDKTAERMRLRMRLLRALHQDAQGNTFKHIPHAQLAAEAQLDHDAAIHQILPYMDAEGWLTWRTTDTVSITEDGMDLVEHINLA